MTVVCVVGLGYIGLPTGGDARQPRPRGDRRRHQRSARSRASRTARRISSSPTSTCCCRRRSTPASCRRTTKPEPGRRISSSPCRRRSRRTTGPTCATSRPRRQSIAPVLKAGDLVILESTSPVGTTERVSRQLARAAARPAASRVQGRPASADVAVAHCPERVLPGQMCASWSPTTASIGGMTDAAPSRGRELYRSFVSGECVTDRRPDGRDGQADRERLSATSTSPSPTSCR